MEVTEAARKELKEKLVANTKETDASIRLQADADGKLSLVLGKEADGDVVVEHEGTKLLLVAQELATMLEKDTIDVEDTKEGRKLVIRPS